MIGSAVLSVCLSVYLVTFFWGITTVRSDWSQTWRSTCLCLLSVGIKGMCHHHLAQISDLWSSCLCPFNILLWSITFTANLRATESLSLEQEHVFLYCTLKTIRTAGNKCVVTVCSVLDYLSALCLTHFIISFCHSSHFGGCCDPWFHFLSFRSLCVWYQVIKTFSCSYK